jgi:NADH-quinone oxidoreductase subunit A
VTIGALPPLATYLILAAIIAGALALLTGELSPHHPYAAKERPYESGVSEPITTQARWPVRYALVGMLFLILDVETLFFYPWAVILRVLGWSGIAAMASFVIVIGVGYFYARSRGALEWR